MSNGSVVFGSLHLRLSCPSFASKRDSLQFSAVLLQMFCDTWPVWGTFFKGTVVQKAQELHFLWQFSKTAQCLTTCSFLSRSILISLFTRSKLQSHLTVPSAVYVRNVSVPMLSQHLLFLLPFCPCCSVGHAGAACLCMVFSGYFY